MYCGVVSTHFGIDSRPLTRECRVVTWMALGMTYAVMRFSIETISAKGRVTCWRRQYSTRNDCAGYTHSRDPSKDIGVEREVVFRDVEPSLDQDLTLECASIIYRNSISIDDNSKWTTTDLL
jgi:hypothetical protein